MKKFLSVNPYTEEVLAEFDAESVESAIEKAKILYENTSWADVQIADRAQAVFKISTELESRKDEASELMTKEMGKRIVESRAEVEKCIWLCEYFAEHAQSFLKPEQIQTDFTASYVRFDPLGVLLAIMPWNFPFWQAIRCIVPALLVGNRAILKHASNVPQSALLLEEIMNAALPENVFANVFLPGSETEGLIASEYIHAVSFTGSTNAGRKVASNAGTYLKKHVLELGGSDPFIVCADADIEKAAQMAVSSRFINSGESCIAAKRIIVLKNVAEKFTSKVKAHVEALQLGDPMDEASDVCPLAKSDIRDDLLAQVEDAKEKGADVLVGGNIFGNKGYLFEPTVLTNVTEDMRVLREETFGPVMPIIIVEDEFEAIRVANNTSFGLGASLWTQDIQHAEELASHIDVGFVSINEIVKSDPRLPFGGIKDSGYGRELSHYGIREFSNIKTVVVKQ